MYQPQLLGVNIDHIATLRQARGGQEPCPVYAAQIAQQAGAHGITLHLREDRRHVQEVDVELIQQLVTLPLNFEMAITDFMLGYAEKIKPEHICLVPETATEITTEGGLEVAGQLSKVADAVKTLQNNGSEVAIFIDPDLTQITAAKEAGATAIEIHTGSYAKATSKAQQLAEYNKIKISLNHALKLGLVVNAGHGLNYQNVTPIAALAGINELNIGHSIISRAAFVGLETAIKDMLNLMRQAKA